MFRTSGVWFLALWEILGAFKQLALFSAQQVQYTLDGTNKAWKLKEQAKAEAEAIRKATMWDRAKEDREALMVAHRADMAALKQKQAADRAKLMAEAEAMAESQARLRALWATSKPKSEKWDYKV